MIILVRPLYRLFLILGLLFWTHASTAQTSSEASVEAPPPVTTESPEAQDAEVIETTETSSPANSPNQNVPTRNDQNETKKKTSDFWGFKRRHSLVYGQVGFGKPGNSVAGNTNNLEIGYEKSEKTLFKWGPYFSRTVSSTNESFTYPNTGYYENRHNAITVYSLGLSARHGLFRYVDIHAGLGASMSSLEVQSVDTDAPAPSTAVGYQETYPLGVDFKVGLQVTKTFSNIGFASELSYQETALGMKHSLSVTSVNFIFRYFYNR